MTPQAAIDLIEKDWADILAAFHPTQAFPPGVLDFARVAFIGGAVAALTSGAHQLPRLEILPILAHFRREAHALRVETQPAKTN